MQGLIRFFFLGYLIFLTILLLTADPARLVGLREGLPWFLLMLLSWAHLLSFLVLAVLALVARWPVPRWSIVVFLVFYACVTELTQQLVPPRSAEWKDWLQDLLGVFIGTAACWATSLAAGAFQRWRRRRDNSPPSGEWEVLEKVMSRPTVGEQSWWG